MQHLIHCSYVAHISVDTEKGVCLEDDAGCGQTGKMSFSFKSPTD